MALSLFLLILSCTAPEVEPALTSEPPIPVNYSTYVSEGLFSISYPPYWTPATSIMEEVWKEAEEWLRGVDPELSTEGQIILFLAGIPTGEGYYPNVNVMIILRSTCFWAFSEIVEADHLWCIENLIEYKEYSQTKINIDGREAVVSDWSDYDPDFGIWRYITSYQVKDKFVWVVTCYV